MTPTETRGRPITDHARSGQARRERYITLRSVRLCTWSVSCGKPAAFGSPCCDRHRDRMTAAMRRLYEARRANDLCRNCGTQVVGRSRCWLCAERRKGHASRQPEYRKMKERR